MSAVPVPRAAQRLTDHQAAEYIGVSITSVRRLRYSGIVPYTKVGTKVLIDVADIDAWLAGAKTPAKPELVDPHLELAKRLAAQAPNVSPATIEMVAAILRSGEGGGS
jgi:excisionase family DNA binding protein